MKQGILKENVKKTRLPPILFSVAYEITVDNDSGTEKTKNHGIPT